MDLFTQKWIDKVAYTREGDLRAHMIAFTYHHFARELDEWIYLDGDKPKVDEDTRRANIDDRSVWRSYNEQRTVRQTNVNWFGFATWATISINRDIRNQRPPLRSERVLPVSLRPWLSPTILNIKAADGQRVSRVLSWGQRLVFLSTTNAFLALQEDPDVPFEVPAEPDPEHPDKKVVKGWAKLVLDKSQWDGENQDLQFTRHLVPIARGFECYRRARRASFELHRVPIDDVARRKKWRMIRARRVLMGNILLTAVEQDVVQRAVRTVIEHVPTWFVDTATARLARLAERYTGVPRRLAASDIPLRLVSSRDVATALWARIMTDQILVMMMPTETLRLGRDIPPRRATQPYFPEDLQHLSEAPPGATDAEIAENDELVRLVSSFDRSRPEGAGTGASDWRRYDERMNWAVSLLRSRQHDPTLFWSPYSDADGGRIYSSHLPERVADPSNYEIIAPLTGDLYRA